MNHISNTNQMVDLDIHLGENICIDKNSLSLYLYTPSAITVSDTNQTMILDTFGCITGVVLELANILF